MTKLPNIQLTTALLIASSTSVDSILLDCINSFQILVKPLFAIIC